eukprot:scaffold798_cov268-Chaetoceros_neogracile.AAC.34
MGCMHKRSQLQALTAMHKRTFAHSRIRNSIYIIVTISAMLITADAASLQPAFASFSLTPSQAISAKTDTLASGGARTSSMISNKSPLVTQEHTVAATKNSRAENSAIPLFLVPSQSINHGNRYVSNRSNAGLNGNSLSSTKNDASVGVDANVNADTNADINTNVKPASKSKKQNKKQTNKSGRRDSYAYYGNIPDVNWRAIPMEHLRSHPLYVPLPRPDTITHLNSLEDVRNFRQDSWQWDALHEGRCTTSQAAPALGFLEPKAAKALGIPRSLQKGCMGAFYRFGQPALRNLEDMNRILPTGGNGGEDELQHVWRRMNYSHVGNENGTFPFAAKYMPSISTDGLKERTENAEKYLKNISSPMRVRMTWGNSQEATAILTALNYFAKHDPDLRVKEVGMCGAGLDLNVTDTGLIVGASPDSVIQYSNGTLEVVEVKNHCPFVPTQWTSGSKAHKNKKMKLGDYRIRELPLQYSVPAAYIPQLMMEMLCCGESCKSAIMVRQTATCGAVILRLHRDDAWIEEMIYWLQRFMVEYVEKDSRPPSNFFWECDEESERYRQFIQRTKVLSEQVELVECVKHNDIQRVLGKRGLRLPLFLDHQETVE